MIKISPHGLGAVGIIFMIIHVAITSVNTPLSIS